MSDAEVDTGMLLEAEGLTVSYTTPQGSLRAVEGVSLRLRRGVVLGVVGESGCGKSTMAFALAGLLPAQARIDAGRIRLAGRDVTTLDPEERRAMRGREVAMVFQDPLTYLNPVMRVGEQIAEKFDAHNCKPAGGVEAEVRRLLQEVGLAPGAAAMYPHELSGGMRQRVLIAMAIACDPALIIADEPTSALDVTTQAQILQLFSDLRRSRDASLLLITHDVGVAAELCDEVCVMYAGRIVEMGSVFDVLDRPAHPYTQALLAAAAPQLERGQSLKGSPPDLHSPPTGCRFHPRCPYITARCSTEEPVLRGRRTRQFACWLGTVDD